MSPSMEASTFQVPTIDILPFLRNPKSAESQKVIAATREACRSTGFFQVVGHGLSPSLKSRFFEASQRFFALSPGEKMKLDARTTVGRRGYDVLESQSYHAGTPPDLKEGFYVGHDLPMDADRIKAARFFEGVNVWPDSEVLAHHDFRDHVEEYFEVIHALALNMLDLIQCTLPYGPDIFRQFTAGSTVSVLRLLHYPRAPPEEPSGGDKQQLGAGAHTDFGAITLLIQDENAGLEVLNSETNEFVAIDPTPNALVFNVGDMLSFWTGGEYKSSVHRVINKASRDRYSAAFFYDGNLDCPLTPWNQKDRPAEGSGALTVEKHMKKRIAASYG
ncbi:putative 2OG-Fe(II) oxygenase family oxidoreductase [Ustulina deusta]|nr:putative 2OG-Fe(II) oxygenase family oxidoreductase [Ustulina deusta]